MKIELESISISSFLNIAEEQTVTFDGPGVYAVLGQNKDEGGSNASGKSAFLRALTVLPQGSKYIDITNKEIKNRILGLPSKISGSYKVNGKLISISRVIGGKLTVSVDGVELDGKTDEIQEKLTAIFGISPEHFIHLTHKMQEDFGGFLLMKDSEKKDFLGSFFDTSKVERAESENSLKIKELTAQLASNSTKLSSLNGNMEILKMEVDTLSDKVSKFTSTEFVSTIASKKSELTHKELELEQVSTLDLESLLSENEEYRSLKAQYDVAQNNLKESEIIISQEISSLSGEIAQLQASLNSPIIVPSDLTGKVVELEVKLKEAKYQQEVLSSLLAEKNQISKSFDIAQKKAQALKPDVCVTCGQSITDDMYRKISESVGIEVRQAADLMDANKKRLEDVLSVKLDEQMIRSEHMAALEAITLFKASQDKTNLKNSLTNLQESLRLKKMAIDEMKRSVKNTEQVLGQFRQTTIDNYNMLVSKLKTEINSVKKEIELLERESTGATESLKTATARYNQCLESVNSIDKSIKEISHKLTLHNKIAEILSRNGFVGYIFDSVLEEINREVNENIKEITVISRLSMYFTPDQVAKSTGSISKSINYKIFDRNEEISFATLSGSEKQSLLIAVDAAVDTVLCRRLGVDINYKILDEQFGWVDSAHKEPLIDFIKNKYHDKIVLIVDHGSELNAAIDKKIVAVKQNGMATISCQAVS